MKNALPACAVVLAALLAPAALAAGDAGLERLDFLLGDWIGSGSGAPGSGSGTFAFRPGLDGRVLVRSARSEYPAAEGKPAVVHDDLLIVYGSGDRAIYFDNEGHVIHYAIRADPEAHTTTFLSDDPGPAFRLTYRELAPGRLRVTFEISPSGKAEDFRTYLDGEALRKGATGS